MQKWCLDMPLHVRWLFFGNEVQVYLWVLNAFIDYQPGSAHWGWGRSWVVLCLLTWYKIPCPKQQFELLSDNAHQWTYAFGLGLQVADQFDSWLDRVARRKRKGLSIRISTNQIEHTLNISRALGFNLRFVTSNLIQKGISWEWWKQSMRLDFALITYVD